ncbi:GST-like protein [Luteibacter sp. HA06]|jgi:GST-like protein
MASLTLYGARTGNSLRAAAALAEAGIDFQPRLVSLHTGEHFKAPFLRMNPLGQVPVLAVSDDTVAWQLTQSNAIMMYAANSSPGLLLPTEPVAAARALERFFFMVTDIIVPSQAAFLVGHHGDHTGSVYLHGMVIERLRFIETFLKTSTYIAGESFSLADICAYTFMRSIDAHLDMDSVPHVKAWMERMSQREGLQRGMHSFN